MKSGAAVVLGLLAIGSPAMAQNGIYKCTTVDGAVVYQGSPCQAQQQQVTLVAPRPREAELPAGNAQLPLAQSAAAGNELLPGMSDTKVLNMRGWGRPTRIERSRGPDGWREEWTYVARDAGTTRLVSFVNGKVEGVTTQDAVQVARARQETQALAEQARRTLESMQGRPDRSRENAPRIERTYPRGGEAIAAADAGSRDAAADAGSRDIVAPDQPTVAQRLAESRVTDDSARTATAAVRSEDSQRAPLRIVRTEPLPSSAEPVPEPLAAVVQYRAEQPFAPSGEPVSQ